MGRLAPYGSFVGAMGVTLRLGKRPDCGCFGLVDAYLERMAGTTHSLARSLGLLSLLLLGLALERVGAPREGRVASQVAEPRGFTLIETLLVILIVGVIVALSVPALHAARESARSSATLANLRSTSQILGVYANDWRGSHPAFADPRNPPHRVAYGGGERVFDRYFDSHTTWNFALADAYLGGRAYPAFISPVGLNQHHFSLSCTLFAAPEFWDLRLRTGENQFRETWTHEVTFPSHKAIVISIYAVLFADKNSPNGVMSLSSRTPFPIAWGDSSATNRRLGMIRPGVESGELFYRGSAHPFDIPAGLHTVGGLRGRDR